MPELEGAVPAEASGSQAGDEYYGGGGDDGDGDSQPILYLQVIRSNNEGNGKWDDWLKLYFCQDHNDKNNC